MVAGPNMGMDPRREGQSGAGVSEEGDTRRGGSEPFVLNAGHMGIGMGEIHT